MSYIGRSVNLNAQPESFYTNASNLISGTVPLARLSVANTVANGVVDITAQSFAGVKTFTSNVTFSGSRTLFASGSVLDWNSGDVTLTHSANTLTFGGASSGYVFNDGSLAWGGGSAITSSTDVVQVTGAQTISGGKTFSSVTGTNFTVTANTPHIIDIQNLSDGSGASSRVRIGNNSSIEGVVLAAFGSAHSLFPNRSRVVTSLINGMDIGAEDASGVIRFYAGGSERTRIGASGNVGIGVTPTSILHLRGSAPTLTLDDSGDTITTISYRPQAAGYAERGAVSWNVTTGEMRISAGASGGSFFQSFYTNGTEQVRITSGGNVGIKAAARFYFDGVAGTGDTYLEEVTANELRIVAAGNERLRAVGSNGIKITGALTVPSGTPIYLDGSFSGDTYFFEPSANIIDFYVGGNHRVRIFDQALASYGTTGIGFYAANGGTNTGTTVVRNGTDGFLYLTTSSRRFKENISPAVVTDAQLDAFMATAPSWWDYKGQKNGALGFIAEDLAALPLDRYGFNPLVNYDGDGQVESNRDYALIAMHHLVIQRMQKEIDALKLQLSKRDV